jgi:hypothetical protein
MGAKIKAASASLILCFRADLGCGRVPCKKRSESDGGRRMGTNVACERWNKVTINAIHSHFLSLHSKNAVLSMMLMCMIL